MTDKKDIGELTNSNEGHKPDGFLSPKDILKTGSQSKAGYQPTKSSGKGPTASPPKKK